MSDDVYTFDSARVRLEQIATEVRKKDTSLEKSLDLLEEGVRLANQCTELIDAKQWRSTLEAAAAEGEESREGEDSGPDAGDAIVVETVTIEELPDGGIIEEVTIEEYELRGGVVDEPQEDDERS